MIQSEDFVSAVKLFYSFLELEFGMSIIEEKEIGNAFYDVQYGNGNKMISISYENIEDYLQVIVFLLESGRLPDYDDKSKTIHINRVVGPIMSKVDKDELSANAQYFSNYKAKDVLERKLLKGAKELRLYLKNV